MHGREKIIINGMLLTTALLWGSSYSFRKMGLDSMGPFVFNGCRFFVGFLIALVVYLVNKEIQKRKVHVHRGNTSKALAEFDEDGNERIPCEGEAGMDASTQANGKKPTQSMLRQILGGVAVGAVYCMGSGAQQLGLVTSDAGKCGFISSIYIILIPILCRIFIKTKLGKQVWIGAILAILGLFFISEGTSLRMAFGDILFLLAALFFAIQIIWVGYVVQSSDPLLVVAAELLTGSIISFALSFAFEQGNTLAGVVQGMIPILYTGILSLGVANILQFLAQKKATPSVAAIIMSLESVFAGLFGAFLLGERMSFLQIFGCGLILAAVLVSQIERSPRKIQKEPKI